MCHVIIIDDQQGISQVHVKAQTRRVNDPHDKPFIKANTTDDQPELLGMDTPTDPPNDEFTRL